ncbi:MAG: A24 family peptidase [Elusimicrobiota bacterium]|jgi:leader peptidase (prepilin peptidase)/N-methyltransferase|nr:A24 family peptidase [Elusimicrobiota bacterium]
MRLFLSLISGFIIAPLAAIRICKISANLSGLESAGKIINLKTKHKFLILLISIAGSYGLLSQYSFSITYIVLLFLLYFLIVIAVIDYNYRIILNVSPLLLTICGLLSCLFSSVLGDSIISRFINSIFGIICGGGILFIFDFIGRRIYKKEVMGGGDIKLMAAAGSIIGASKIITALFFGFLLGAVIGFVLILFKKADKKDYIPFGPFLAAGIYISLFFNKIPFLL